MRPYALRRFIRHTVIALLAMPISSPGAARENHLDKTALAQEASCITRSQRGWKPVLGQDNQAPPALDKPVRGVPFIDPLYGTCLVRLTDHAADGLAGFARTDYSRRQAFNADNSQVLISAMDGSWHVYNAQSCRHEKKLTGIGGDAEPQWHPGDPELLYYFPTNGIGMQIREYNLRTDQSRVVTDLAARLKAIWPGAHAAWTKSEGSPSADARYWALQVDDQDWRGLGLISYDMKTDTILATYDLGTHGRPRPDHLSMSPSGRYVVVSFDEGPCAYYYDFTGERKLATKGEHSDVALDAEGDDVYVSIDYGGKGGQVYCINLRTGIRTNLFPTYLSGSHTAMHFSGKAFNKPGWVLVSTYADGGSRQWLHKKVFAVQLRSQPLIVNLAHHHQVLAKHPVHGWYFTEPHASVNRDFTRVVFNSNWDLTDPLDIDSYMLTLPDNALP